MDWYYIDPSKPEGKRRSGPWSPRQLFSFAEQGAFTAETLVWRDGFKSWTPWGVAGTELKTEFQVETVKEIIEEKILPQINAQEANYAGIWQRVCAFLLDYIIVQFLFMITSPMHAFFGVVSEMSAQPTPAELMPSMFFIFALFFIYDAFFVKNFSGTPGKIALKLVVVRNNGKAMTWSCAFLRSFVGLSFIVGSLLAAFDIERRALHDFIADTRVLRIGTVN